MATKKYQVREGFVYSRLDTKGIVKIYSEGDTLDIEDGVGVIPHQLELASEKDRAKAAADEIAANTPAPAAA